MDNKEEETAKKKAELSWRKCPICAQKFQDFLPLIKHLEEHSRLQSQMVKIELGAKDYLAKKVAQEFAPFVRGTDRDGRKGPRQSRTSKRKFTEEAKGLLPVVADWIEQALTTFSEINSMVTSDVKVAEELVVLARRLPNGFREQRGHLLIHEKRLKETGMDPKWPRKAGSQIRFVAESMAGAEWDLSPSTSREFIRQQKPRRGATPAVPQCWWDPGSKDSNEEQG